VSPGGWLVLCSAADTSALWVYERLRARANVPIGLLLLEALEGADVIWEHRVSARGAGSTTLRTADGRSLRSADVGAVLNRVAMAPLGVLAAADPADREYAHNELTAFAASWLGTLSASVVNQPDPHGLCGRWRQPLHWRALAARAGMACAPIVLTSADPASAAWNAGAGTPSTTALAIDGRLLHDGVPSALQDACARLCRASQTRILGLRFEGTDPAATGWRLLDATPYPDLSLAGEAGVAALEQALAA
jgi:hypothetical protein